MKNCKLPLYVHVCLYAVTMFVVLWCMWYFNYHYSLLWLEGFSYFSTFPDVLSLAALLPDDILKYAGAFFLQFYYYPAVGAALQALFPVVIMLCAMVVVIRLFDNPSHLLWLAALPVTFFVEGQYWDYTLTRTLTWVIVSVVIVVALFMLTIWKRKFIHVTPYIANVFVEIVALIAILASSINNLVYKDEVCHQYEYVWKLEHLAETRQWDALLETATPEKAQVNEYARRYAVLALLEKGELADRMLMYNVTSPDDFWFNKREEPMCRNYNAMLFRSLDMPNEVIHNTFQQQVQSEFGTCFAVLRRLAETNLETKNYPLAKKYMDILSHSTVMKWWVEDRKERLEAIKTVKPVFEAKGKQFISYDLKVFTSAMYNRYPDNHKYADMILCGLIASRSGDDFYSAFQVIAKTQYAHGEHIPRYYQEALMLAAAKNPEVLQTYSIDNDVKKDFQNVMKLVNDGETTQVRALYPNTVWAYCL